MGRLKHNAIVVTGWDEEAIRVAHEKAKEIFKSVYSQNIMVEDGSQLVSGIIYGVVNGQSSFFIAPDGSKEGWSDSVSGDTGRKIFCDWLRKDSGYCDYVEIVFGGDDEYEEILRSRDKDIED